MWSDVESKSIDTQPLAGMELLSADAVRRSAQRLLAVALAGGLKEWTIDLDRLEPTADFVAGVITQRYPRLDVPVHSRWRHFVFNGHDLWRDLQAQAAWSTPESEGRAAFDLVITSVLLDAGAGVGWRFVDGPTGLSAARSEGLALASLRWFASGALSNHPDEPLRVDAAALRRIDAAALRRAFQCSADNPLVGLEGRAALLNRLGAALDSRPDLFASCDSPRPGGLFDALPAPQILQTLLDAFGSIWEDRPALNGVPLGDCWPHPALVGDRPQDGYAVLHKLSQWLAYSLIEPLATAGVRVRDVDGLTGLAEYRNGGLFIDMGVINAREPATLLQAHSVADPFVVGWRSLTVALLDRIAPLIRTRLELDAERFPLACVLEGGTWAAGRQIAAKRREGGGPPFQISSDGTVF